MALTKIKPSGLDQTANYTFAGVTATGNLSAGNVSTAGVTATGNIAANNFATSANSAVILKANNGTDIRQIQLIASTDANFTANYTLTLPTTDGNAGQALLTDGSGVLSWGNAGGGGTGYSIANGNSNISIDEGAAIRFSANGIANVLTVTTTNSSNASAINLGIPVTSAGGIVDTSATNASLTTNGSVTTPSDVPAGGGGTSMQFPGQNTAYVAGALNAALNMTGDFTWETWLYVASGTSQTAYSNMYNTYNDQISFVTNDAGTPKFKMTGPINLQYNVSPVDGVWHHMAVTRSGTSMTLWVDGVSRDTGTSSAAFNLGSAGPFRIGAGTNGGSDNPFNGRLYNLRISNISRYGSNFTPSASYAPDADTVLFVTVNAGGTSYYSTVGLGNANLTGNLNVSGTSNLGPVGNVVITGGSSGQHLMTDGAGGLSWGNVMVTEVANGNSGVSVGTLAGNVTVSVNGFTKALFSNAGMSLTQTALTGGSALFDGTNQFTVPASSDWAVGTGDFTVEYFFNCSGDYGSNERHWALGPQGGSWNSVNLGLSFEGSASSPNILVFRNGAYQSISTIPSINESNWYHVALVRASGVMTLYFGGVGYGAFNDSTNITDNTSLLYIGGRQEADYFTGRMTNFRWTKGTAVYTSNFTPPSAPLSVLANTKLLMLMASSGALTTDSAGLHTVTNVGSVAFSNQSPFVSSQYQVGLALNSAQAANYTITLPTTDGNANQFLQTDGNGITTWAAPVTASVTANSDNTVGNVVTLTINGVSYQLLAR